MTALTIPARPDSEGPDSEGGAGPRPIPWRRMKTSAFVSTAL